jgi:hypothetical protein
VSAKPPRSVFSWPNAGRPLVYICLRLFLAPFFARAVEALAGGDSVAPCALGLSRDGQSLYVACGSSHQVLGIDTQTQRITQRFLLPWEPTGLALMPTDDQLLVTGQADTGIVAVLNARDGQLVRVLTVGAHPCAPVWNTNKMELYAGFILWRDSRVPLPTRNEAG